MKLKTLLLYTLYALATPLLVLSVTIQIMNSGGDTVAIIYASLALAIQAAAIAVLMIFEDELIH